MLPVSTAHTPVRSAARLPDEGKVPTSCSGRNIPHRAAQGPLLTVPESGAAPAGRACAREQEDMAEAMSRVGWWEGPAKDGRMPLRDTQRSPHCPGSFRSAASSWASTKLHYGPFPDQDRTRGLRRDLGAASRTHVPPFHKRDPPRRANRSYGGICPTEHLGQPLSHPGPSSSPTLDCPVLTGQSQD